MNMLIKRRQLIMATLVVALGSAVFVNWYFTNSDGNVVNTSETTNEYVQNLGEAKYVDSQKVDTKDTTNKSTAAASKNTDYCEIKKNQGSRRSLGKNESVIKGST